MSSHGREPLRLLRRSTPWRRWSVLAIALVASLPGAVAGAEPLRVVLLAPDPTARASLNALETALTRSFGFNFRSTAAEPWAPDASLAALHGADAAIVYRGPGAIPVESAALLRGFLGAGKALVVIAATPEAWPTEPRFVQDVLGATPGAVFAGGSPLTIINLFAHPILTGVSRFETNEPVSHYTKLAEDTQMIMEGTTGEATAPLAWVRRRPAGDVAHFVFGDPQVLAHPAYQTMLGQAVLWAAQRPIPGARPAVQRTLMAESYPGAFAITLPNGPGVCLDPVRGGINYIWAGDFVDLRPRWITKQGEPARIFGPVFYREKDWQPLRSGAPDAEPDFQFRGYALRDGVPEFHYQIGGRDVYETFSPGSVTHSLIRHFRVGPGATPLWLTLEPQSAAEVIARGLERDGNLASFHSVNGGEFTIEIRPKFARVP